MNPIRLLAMPTVVLGLAFVSPSHAQHIADVDTSSCVTDPEGQVYFSLYGWVFAFDRDHDIEFELDIRLEHPDEFQQQIRDRDNPTRERWPEPFHADEPMGCPGNPIMTTEVGIEPTYEQLGVAPQTRRHPVVEEEFAGVSLERLSGPVLQIRPTRYNLTAWPSIPLDQPFQPTLDRIQRFCDAGITNIAAHLSVCHLGGGDGKYFENLERQFSVIFVADSDYYTDPYGLYFDSSCEYVGVNSLFSQLRCSLGYSINGNLSVQYRYSLSNYPVHQIIPVDSAFRSYLSNAFKPDLSRPLVGVVEDLRLPTIDHLTLIDQQRIPE